MDAAGPASLTGAAVGPRDAVARLRGAGVRVTKQRVAVFDQLERLGGHRSVEEISADLIDVGAALPLTTIYNVVDDLSRAGILMAADAGSGRALYEVADTWHHHFVCRSCGQVSDIACTVGVKPCIDASVPGAEVDEASIIFRGRCRSCVSDSS